MIRIIFTGALAVSNPSSINCNIRSFVKYLRESSRSFSLAELDLKRYNDDQIDFSLLFIFTSLHLILTMILLNFVQ
jgi:hypothetical protein